jgi:beta propeller repeat protein
VDDGPNGQFIRRLDTSTWNDEVAQYNGDGIKPSMDKKLVWLNFLTKRPRYQSVASGQISVICKAPEDKSHLAVSGNYVVWMDNHSGIPGVYIYSLA